MTVELGRKATREIKIPSETLGEQFIERWFVPELISEDTLDPAFLIKVGETLKSIAKSFPKTDHVPGWEKILRWEDRLSVFDPHDLRHESRRGQTFIKLWAEIRASLNLEVLYYPKGSKQKLREYDFLVTTPLDQAESHVQEAQDAINYYKKTGEVDYYYRDCWPYPKNLRIGSKFFYVDNRAIRGFAIVTDIDINKENANLAADTWRWIVPIHCDYQQTKPPQRYACAVDHEYLKGINQVRVIGEWLDPMPK
ncbi:MAG: hypothetical protein AAB548_02065 [Patescibacteria group bacterium]